MKPLATHIRLLGALSLALALAATAMLTGGLRPALAGEDGGWDIQRFLADITIEPDGALLITEAIDADFHALQRHGIVREIPVEYGYDSAHNRVYGFETVAVTDGAGQPLPYEEARSGANVQLRIGDPARTVTGQQSYRITYRVRDALNAFPDHDELYWNVTGANTPVPMGDAGVVVRSAAGGLLDAVCYHGERGSDARCNAGIIEGGTQMIGGAGRELFPGEQVTIAVSLRKGIVPEPQPRLVEKPETAWETFRSFFKVEPLYAIIAAAIGAAGFGVFLANWWRNGRDRAYRSLYYLTGDTGEGNLPLLEGRNVVVEYTPPEELRPAQMGVLLDERADTKDVTATIIDLAVRGFLAIEEKEKKWLLGSRDWRLVKLKEPRALKPYERTIFNGIFANGATEVDLSDLKDHYIDSLNAAQRQLYDDAMRNKWFARDPAATRQRWGLIGAGVIAGGAALSAGLGWLFGAGLVGVPVVVIGVLLLFTSSWMPRRTAKGSEALRRILGFRLYIDMAETARQQFNEKANIFAEYLPYAIVFGCVEKWARAFRNIDTTTATQSWYAGGRMFSATEFSSRLERFASSLSSVITSTPGSSGASGFSGGSAGGGGGGGGVRSW